MECFIYLSADFQQYQDKRKATWKFLSNPVLFRFSKDLLQSTAHNLMVTKPKEAPTAWAMYPQHIYISTVSLEG